MWWGFLVTSLILRRFYRYILHVNTRIQILPLTDNSFYNDIEILLSNITCESVHVIVYIWLPCQWERPERMAYALFDLDRNW